MGDSKNKSVLDILRAAGIDPETVAKAVAFDKAYAEHAAIARSRRHSMPQGTPPGAEPQDRYYAPTFDPLAIQGSVDEARAPGTEVPLVAKKMREAADITENIAAQRNYAQALMRAKGISPEDVAKAQGLACGGEVKGYADGGSVADTIAEEWDKLKGDPLSYGIDLGMQANKASTLAKNLAVGAVAPTLGKVTGITPALENLEYLKKQGLMPQFPVGAKPTLEKNPEVAATPDTGGINLGPEPSAPSMPMPSPYISSAGYDKALAAEQKAVQGVGDAQAAQAEAKAQGLQEQQSMMLANQAKMAETTQHIRERQQKAVDVYNEAIKKLSDPAETVDPNRFWADKSTGEKILLALGMGFSGAGGGPNVVAEMVNNAIARDIDAQKTNIASRRHGLEAQAAGAMNMYQMYREQGMDEVSAEKLAHATGLEIAKNTSDQIAARAEGPEAKAKAQATSAALMTEAAKYKQQISLHEKELALKSMSIAGRETRGATLPPSAQTRLAMQRAALSDMVKGKQLFEATDKAAVVRQFSPFANPDTEYDAFKPALAEAAAVGAIGGKPTNYIMQRHLAMLPDSPTPSEKGMLKIDASAAVSLNRFESEIKMLKQRGFDTTELEAEAQQFRQALGVK